MRITAVDISLSALESYRRNNPGAVMEHLIQDQTV
jgi:hypothetical protein